MFIPSISVAEIISKAGLLLQSSTKISFFLTSRKLITLVKTIALR